MRKESLEFYVNKLKNKEYFSLARYGDGEFYCLWGRGSRNSNGCYYTPELKKDLEASFHHRHDPDFIYGMQRVLPQDMSKAEAMYPVDWYDSEVFGDCLAAGKLYPLIAQLRLMKTVVIGNDSLRPISRIFYYNHFISVPESNAHKEIDRVIEEILDFGPACYLFSAGMAANAMVARLHKQMPETFLFDVGHIWDPFVGNLSRCNLEHMSDEEIEMNLVPR